MPPALRQCLSFIRNRRAGPTVCCALVFPLVLGCGSSPGGDRHREPASPRRLLGDTVTIADPEGLVVAGDWLAVADPSAFQRLIIVDRRSGAVVSTTGTEGSGPGELRFPSFLFAESTAPPQLLVYDTQNGRAVRYRLSADGEATAVDHVSHGQGGAVEQLVTTTVGLVVGGAFPNSSLLVVDSHDHEVRGSFGTPPLSREVYQGPLSYNGNRFHLAAHPTRPRFAAAFIYVSRIDFIDVATGTAVEVQSPREVPLPSQHDPQLEYFATHAGGATATERFVYVTYCDECPEGRRERESRRPRWWERGKPRLVHVYTWEGDFVTEFALDRRVTALAVVPGDSILYATVEEPYPLIGEWTLPAQLHALQAGMR